MEQVLEPRTLPVLIDDVIWQILVRIPPDESAHLAGASLVCKLWRRIISDPGFARRYRELHRTPPLLGFLHNTESGRLFFPTEAACPFPQPPIGCRRLWTLDYRGFYALDCRHGRALLLPQSARKRNFLVQNPITGEHEEVPIPQISFLCYSAMVLCATAGCDHGDCIGGPFLVVFMGFCEGWARGCVYSSESRAWGMPVSLQLGTGFLVEAKRPALVGDDAYFFVGEQILKFSLYKNRLSTFGLPDGYSRWNAIVMPTDDGSLGLAAIRDSNLCLWSREVNVKGGVARWVQRRVMELEKLLPIDNIFRTGANMIGFAEGVGVVFVRIQKSTFMIELKSGRVKKLNEVEIFHKVLPFMSFYNPGSASSVSVLPLPAERK